MARQFLFHRRAPRFLVVTGALFLCVAAGPLDELPYPRTPPDPQALLDSIVPRLPSNWKLSQPDEYLGVAEVRVNIDGDWRGNPIAAAVALCPGTEDTIWQQTRLIRLIMRFHARNSPPYDCRP